MIRNFWFNLISGLIFTAGVMNLPLSMDAHPMRFLGILQWENPLALAGQVKTFLETNDNGNTPPVAVSDAYTTAEDTALVVSAPGVLVNDTDVDGDSLTAVLVDGPLHGVLTLNEDGSFTYVPVANYHGGDSFTYKASDGQVYSDVVTVSLTIDVERPQPPTWRKPVENQETYTLKEDSALLSVTVEDSDVDFVRFYGYDHKNESVEKQIKT